jgi:transposase-like protein
VGRRTFSQEFKLEAVRAVRERGLPCSGFRRADSTSGVVDLAAREISRTMQSRHAFDRALLRVIREYGGTDHQPNSPSGWP